MTARRGFIFTCDSPEGCLAHAMAEGHDVAVARANIVAALDWSWAHDSGYRCPAHRTVLTPQGSEW